MVIIVILPTLPTLGLGAEAGAVLALLLGCLASTSTVAIATVMIPFELFLMIFSRCKSANITYN